MRYLQVFALLIIFVSCKNRSSENPHNYKKTYYLRVEDDYQYSRELFNYKSNVFRPIVTEEYISDTLNSVILFKSEGKMNYSRADIDSDPLFFQMLNTCFMRSIVITESQVRDNGMSYHIIEMINDSVFTMQKDTLLLYEID